MEGAPRRPQLLLEASGAVVPLGDRKWGTVRRPLGWVAWQGCAEGTSDGAAAGASAHRPQAGKPGPPCRGLTPRTDPDGGAAGVRPTDAPAATPLARASATRTATRGTGRGRPRRCCTPTHAANGGRRGVAVPSGATVEQSGGGTVDHAPPMGASTQPPAGVHRGEGAGTPRDRLSQGKQEGGAAGGVPSHSLWRCHCPRGGTGRWA